MSVLEQTPVLLFDLDGTLTDSRIGILNCIQYALEACNMPEPDQTKLYPFVGPPLCYSFREFMHMDDEMNAFAVAKYRERFSTVGMFENAVFDGIPQLLSHLREKGFTLAVATSKPEVYTLQILDHFQLTEYFHVIAGSHLEIEGETKADVIRFALERLNLPTQAPNGVLMIGDRMHDVDGAKECGIPCLGIGYGYAPKGELAEHGAIAIVNSVAELEQYLFS